MPRRCQWRLGWQPGSRGLRRWPEDVAGIGGNAPRQYIVLSERGPAGAVGMPTGLHDDARLPFPADRGNVHGGPAATAVPMAIRTRSRQGVGIGVLPRIRE